MSRPAMRESVLGCPHCGGPVRAFGVYKHRWWACAACGCATRVPRAWIPGDRVPRSLRRCLPAGLVRSGGLDPFFRSPDPEVGRREFAQVTGWLAALGVEPAGADVLDLGGGPGFVAAGLLAAGARTAVVAEFSPHARDYAARRGLRTVEFCFGSTDLAAAPGGRFGLVLARYAIGWCADLPAFVDQLSPITSPGSGLVLTFVTPTRGACLGTALEDAAPAVLWHPDHVVHTFASAGWALVSRFEAAPPMPFGVPHGRAFRVLSAPWRLQPCPLPATDDQHHAGLFLRRTD